MKDQYVRLPGLDVVLTARAGRGKSKTPGQRAG